MRLNQNLVSLLRDLEGRVDEADKRVINQVLQDVSLNAQHDVLLQENVFNSSLF